MLVSLVGEAEPGQGGRQARLLVGAHACRHDSPALACNLPGRPVRLSSRPVASFAEQECIPPEVANYTFEAGKDSTGEELQVVAEFGSPADLAAACAAAEGCAAFTTDGRLRGPSDGGLVDWPGGNGCTGVYIRDELPPSESVEGVQGWSTGFLRARASEKGCKADCS